MVHDMKCGLNFIMLYTVYMTLIWYDMNLRK